jgi:hypothetical protein
MYNYVKDHAEYSEMTLGYELALLDLEGCYKRLQRPLKESNIVKNFTLQELLNPNFNSADELEALALLDKDKFIQGNEYSSTDVSCAREIYYAVRKIKRSRKKIKELEEKRKIDKDYFTNFTPDDLHYTCIPIID